jgi:hypothetical protein
MDLRSGQVVQSGAEDKFVRQTPDRRGLSIVQGSRILAEILSWVMTSSSQLKVLNIADRALELVGQDGE